MRNLPIFSVSPTAVFAACSAAFFGVVASRFVVELLELSVRLFLWAASFSVSRSSLLRSPLRLSSPVFSCGSFAPLADLADAKDIRLILEDQFPKIQEASLVDPRINAVYNVTIRCRRLGEDNGKDQLVNISNYLRGIRDFMQKAARKPTKEELARLTKLVGGYDG